MHSIDLLGIFLKCNGIIGIQKAVVTANYQTLTFSVVVQF